MLSVSTVCAREDDLRVFRRMLESVAFADEIVVFNMERSDKEWLTLARELAFKVIEVKTPKIVEEIRSRQVREVSGDWVLVMDFDEIIPKELASEIKDIMKEKQGGAYAIRRRNFSLGFPLSHGGWGDDYVVRLFHKADFLDWPTNIHSVPHSRGELVKMEHYMEHHKDASLASMVAKTNRYSEIEAQLFFDGGLPPVTPLTLIRKSVMEFVRRYFLKAGFLDGRIGVIQSLYQGYSVFISYAKLYEKQQQHKNAESDNSNENKSRK